MTTYVSSVSIHACRYSGRHNVVFERDDAIFNSILDPLCDLEPSLLIDGSQSLSLAIEDGEEHVQKVARKSQLSV